MQSQNWYDALLLLCLLQLVCHIVVVEFVADIRPGWRAVSKQITGHLFQNECSLVLSFQTKKCRPRLDEHN